jgi:predicted secreted protein
MDRNSFIQEARMKKLTGFHMALAVILAVLAVSSFCMAHRLIYTNPNVTIYAPVGHDFSIGLESNPATGFTWSLAKPIDSSILKFVGKEFKYAKEDLRLTGAHGKEIWVFNALKAGRTKISMKFVRTWEDEPTEITYRNFNVIIK